MIEIVDTKTYRINAILHSLSRKKAQEEIDMEILRDNGINQPSENCRHRVIIFSRDKFDYWSDHGNKRLVSLFFHGGGYLEASPSYWNSFLELRISDLEDFGIKILPESIGKLIELRYLGLRNNYIQELPYSLGCLKKLEVLDIAQNFIVELPEIIWEMDSLLHLYVSDVICRTPSKIDALKYLKTLTYITFDNWTYELSCPQTSSLRKLGIVDLDSDVSKLFASFAKFWCLEYLIFRGNRLRSMPSLDELGILKIIVPLKLDGLLPRLPSNFPLKLERLTLVNSCLDEDPMPLLRKLPDLYHLKLRNAYTGQQMVISADGFPKLEHLFIEESWNLRNVQVRGGVMPLRHFEIKNCPNLENLPEVRGWVTLHILITKNIAREFRKSASISKLKLEVIKP